MSSNARRKAAKDVAILVYGEGADEETFLTFIKGIYGKSKAAIISNSRGGCASKTVNDLRRNTSYSVATKKYVVIDSDKPTSGKEISDMQLLIGNEKIIPIISKWNIEYELLTLLRLSGVKVKANIGDNPQTLKKKLFSVLGPFTTEDLSSFFQKSNLDILRKKSEWLNQIISIFE